MNKKIILFVLILFVAGSCSLGGDDRVSKIKRFSEDPEENSLEAINRDQNTIKWSNASAGTVNPELRWNDYTERGTFDSYSSSDGKYGTVATVSDLDGEAYNSYFGVKYKPEEGYVQTAKYDDSGISITGTSTDSTVVTEKKSGNGYLEKTYPKAPKYDTDYVDNYYAYLPEGRYLSTANEYDRVGYLTTAYDASSETRGYLQYINGTPYLGTTVKVATMNYNDASSMGYVEKFGVMNTWRENL